VVVTIAIFATIKLVIITRNVLVVRAATTAVGRVVEQPIHLVAITIKQLRNYFVAIEEFNVGLGRREWVVNVTE